MVEIENVRNTYAVSANQLQILWILTLNCYDNERFGILELPNRVTKPSYAK